MRSDRKKARDTAVGFVVGLMIGGLIDALGEDLGIATLLGMVLGSLIGYYGVRRVFPMEFPKPAAIAMAATAIVFVATLLASSMVPSDQAGETRGTILILLPILPGVLFIAAVGYAISLLDELQKRIQLEALALGAGILATVALAVGLASRAGVSQPNWMWALAVLACGFMAGKLWARWNVR